MRNCLFSFTDDWGHDNVKTNSADITCCWNSSKLIYNIYGCRERQQQKFGWVFRGESGGRRLSGTQWDIPPIREIFRWGCASNHRGHWTPNQALVCWRHDWWRPNTEGMHSPRGCYCSKKLHRVINTKYTNEKFVSPQYMPLKASASPPEHEKLSVQFYRWLRSR